MPAAFSWRSFCSNSFPDLDICEKLAAGFALLYRAG
jgi:hypothetical protein